MLSASEFEVIAKALCLEAGISLPQKSNMTRLTREIIGMFPHIGETVITTLYQSIQPLREWRIIQITDQNGNNQDKVDGLSWWDDYNSIKHDRIKSFRAATLKNCVDALAALYVLELYLSQKAIDNLDEITSIRCEYFDCNYGLSYLVANAEKKLPDFS